MSGVMQFSFLMTTDLLGTLLDSTDFNYLLLKIDGFQRLAGNGKCFCWFLCSLYDI